LAATVAFLGVNGRSLTLSNDQAYEVIIEVATGELDEVAGISDRIRRGSEARHP
jgi:death-on-curing protein